MIDKVILQHEKSEDLKKKVGLVALLEQKNLLNI